MRPQLFVLSLAFLMSLSSFAKVDSALAKTSNAPDCLSSNDSPLPIMNDQVSEWKRKSDNQFLARAHVNGKIVNLFNNATNHEHFVIQFGESKDDTLEVIYNESFGALPDLSIGMSVEACGDYITSNQDTDRYKASPIGAIIHWIHKAPNPTRHPSGYLMINGIVYGQDLSKANKEGQDFGKKKQHQHFMMDGSVPFLSDSEQN